MTNSTTVDQGSIISTEAEELESQFTVSFQSNPGDSSGPLPLVIHVETGLVVIVVVFEDAMECQWLQARHVVVVVVAAAAAVVAVSAVVVDV